MGASETPEPTEQPEPKRSSEPRRIWPAVRALLRTRIVAGLAMVVPLWVTWVVAKFVFDATRSATQPIVDWIVRYFAQKQQAGKGTAFFDQLQRRLNEAWKGDDYAGAIEIAKELQGFLAAKVPGLSEAVPPVPPRPGQIVTGALPAYVDWIVPVVAVLLTLMLLYMLGLLTANVFGRRLVLLVERLFENLPLVKTLYGSTKRIVLTLGGGGEAMQFQKVVLVEFPRPGMKCIGFLTSVMKDVDTGRKMATVFISTTPNPTTGYMQVVPLEEVSETGWTVEEAVKLLMSGGIVSPPTVPFDIIHPVKGNQTRTVDARDGPTAQLSQDVRKSPPR